jgi:hypothetical protein
MELGDLPQAQADMLATIKAQRTVLEQALEALTYQGNMGPTRRQRRVATITAIQGVLK